MPYNEMGLWEEEQPQGDLWNYSAPGFDPTPPKQVGTSQDPFVKDPALFDPTYNAQTEAREAYYRQVPTQAPQGAAPPTNWNRWSTATPTDVTGGATFAPLPGYDFGKLSDPTHRGPGKYNPDVGLFSQGLSTLGLAGQAPTADSIQKLVAWMNANGGKVSWNGKDNLTFADGRQVDVATDYNPAGQSGAWSFQDPLGRAQGGSQVGAGPVGRAPMSLGPSGFPSLGGLSLGGSTLGGEDDWREKGLQELFQSSMESVRKPVGSAQFESLRQPIDKARRTSMNQVRANLANRGMLLGSGELANAAGRIEERLAPDFASAVQRASVENTQDSRQAALGALQGGTNYQQVKGDLALRQLDQNRQWNQFLGDFGLRRAQVQEMLNQGQIDQLLQYYQLWLQGTQIGAGGMI